MPNYVPQITLTKPDNNYHLSFTVDLGPLKAIALNSLDPNAPNRTYVYDVVVVPSGSEVFTDSHIIIGDGNPATHLDIHGADSVEIIINAPGTSGPTRPRATKAYSSHTIIK